MEQVQQLQDGWPPGSLDLAFSPGGRWEARNGPRNTVYFAKAFVKNVTIPFDNFTLLDVGCALGNAIPVLREAYPDAKLYGCDVSGVALERCAADFGHMANFFKAGFEELSGFWDVIYCCAVLEHFKDYWKVASRLLGRCKIAYIMVPYFELEKGKPLDATGDHKVTFYKDSFDFLYNQGLLASPVKTKVIRCPKAWSAPWPKDTLRQIRRAVKMALFLRYFPVKGRMIIYELHNKG
jgi:hypothetical protein